MASDKAQVGFFSFTEVTDPTQHIAFNEWHQLDHMPEQLPLHGIVHGQRWVRTPECATASRLAVAPFDSVHYVTAYLMAEPLEQTLADFFQLGRDLAAVGRFFDARTSHFARPLRVQAVAANSRVGIRALAIPYRPHRGVHVTVEQVAPHSVGRPPFAQLDELASIEGVSGAWSFASDTQLLNSRSDNDTYCVTVAWIDGEVFPTTRRIDAFADRAVPANRETLFRGPLLTITPWQWNWFEGERQ